MSLLYMIIQPNPRFWVWASAMLLKRSKPLEKYVHKMTRNLCSCKLSSRFWMASKIIITN